MICTVWDDWLEERKELTTLWTAELTDGTVVYQDDDRPGMKPESAWIRLKRHCKKRGLGIEFMRISFRSNCKDVGRGADAFFFCKSILCGMLSTKNTHFYIVGTINNDKLSTVKWEVPSLLEAEATERDIVKSEKCIIWKPEKRKLWLRNNANITRSMVGSGSLLHPSI